MRRRDLLTTLGMGCSAWAPISFLGASTPLRARTATARERDPEGTTVVRAGDRAVGAEFGTRSPVFGASAAAASAHPLATLVGIEILKRDGSALDAAVAMNACLGFLEPTSCGIGGDLCAMVWDPGSARLSGLIGAGRSPQSLDLATARARSKAGSLPPYGAVTVSVPGAVDAWWELHQRFGRMRWSELFEPAIDMAEAGVAMAPVIASNLRHAIARISQPGMGIEETANIIRLFAPNGETPPAGAIFRNRDLAQTYRMISQGGRDVFYRGPVARTIDAYFKRVGGWLSFEDLTAHKSEWSTPLKTSYRGVDVFALGGNTQGIASLQMLNILEHFDLRRAGFQSARSIHLQAEAKRLAFADRARYYADPGLAYVPAQFLASKEYASERAKLIRLDRRLDLVPPGTVPTGTDTTYFTATDRRGMMVSMIQSNFRNVGSGLVPDGLGFGMQGRGQLFTLQSDHPNLYAPGKRPLQTIMPGFAMKQGWPWLSFGVTGGDFQPQGQIQILLNMIDYDLDVQAAGDSPRWHHQGSPESMGEYDKSSGPSELLRLERGVPESTRFALERLGWAIGSSDDSFGNYQAIERSARPTDAVYSAGSEMRVDGCALAF